MIRRSFRVGMWLGVLLGIVIALVKSLQGQRDARDLAAPPAGRWEPPAPPLSDAVVAGTADLDVAQVAEKPAGAARTWVEPTGAVCPGTHPVKAKMASGLFHLPGMLNYTRTRPDRCYASDEAALADGLTKAKR